VQQCLVGKKHNLKTFDLQKEINKINENAPEQARALLEYYKNHHLNQ
jgi:hypothetical protein